MDNQQILRGLKACKNLDMESLTPEQIGTMFRSAAGPNGVVANPPPETMQVNAAREMLTHLWWRDGKFMPVRGHLATEIRDYVRHRDARDDEVAAVVAEFASEMEIDNSEIEGRLLTHVLRSILAKATGADSHGKRLLSDQETVLKVIAHAFDVDVQEAFKLCAQTVASGQDDHPIGFMYMIKDGAGEYQDCISFQSPDLRTGAKDVWPLYRAPQLNEAPIVVPEWSTEEVNVDDPLAVFVDDNDPAQARDSRVWRESVRDLLKHYTGRIVMLAEDVEAFKADPQYKHNPDGSVTFLNPLECIRGYEYTNLT